MKSKVSWQEMMAIGFMLFALFFGAGNLIFPPALGQAAGANLGSAMLGFLLTGVGLPLLGVMAVGVSGNDDAQAMADKVHPLFALGLMVSIYLTIGPLFAIPRTGAVSFEMGVKPFLTAYPQWHKGGLLLHTIVFFGITYWLSLNPSKLVDRVGKILTPLLLISLTVLLVQPFIQPLGQVQGALKEYVQEPFFTGFKEGYLTMDTLASVVFGIVVINAIKEKGVRDPREITRICAICGLIAAGCLALIYVALGYMGAVSVERMGLAANGGILLAAIANHYFGAFGNVVLGMAISFACLTTSIGLVSSCATYFNKLIPGLSYRRLVAVFSLFSMAVANVGLSQLIAFSVPVLVALYPMVIVLISLSFADPLFSGRQEVYAGSMFLTAVCSMADGLQAAGLLSVTVQQALTRFVPLYEVGFAWLVPAIVGAIVGYVFYYLRRQFSVVPSESCK